MDHKQALLTEADTAFADLRRAIAGLDDRRMSDPWLGTWSVREILIHVSGWHREVISALGRLAAGQPAYPDGVSYDDFDAWNARFVEAKAGAPLPEVMAELEAAHRDFLAAAAALPADQLAPGGAARALLEGAGPQHYCEHTSQILAWRATGGSCQGAPSAT
jgi:hypothetical protein